MRGVLRCPLPRLLGSRLNRRCLAPSPRCQAPDTRLLQTKSTVTTWWKPRAAEDSASSGDLSSDRTSTSKSTESPKASAAKFDEEKVEDELASLLEKYGLSDLPDPEVGDHGVSLDKENQIIITDEVKARKKHRTALILSPAPMTLSRRDFSRLEADGAHLPGWKVGGLEEVIPARSTSLERRPGWILIFGSPYHAYEYQQRAHRIREAARKLMPFSPTTGIQPLRHHPVPTDRGFTIQDYTLTSSWQYPGLYAVLSPFSRGVSHYIDRQRNLVSSDHKSGTVFPVRVWIEEDHQIALDASILARLIRWDELNRGVGWNVVDADDAYTRITGRLRHQILDRDGDEPDALGPTPNDNWRILFENASSARRFVRVWHRRQLPGILALRLSDPIPPVLNAECLFYDEDF